MEQTVTHIQQRRNEALSVQQQVLQVLQANELEYLYTKYHHGLAYLRLYTKNDEQAVAFIERQKIYWNWWKNHWTIREEEFLLHAWRLSPGGQLRLWKDLHNPRILAQELTPHGHLLGDTYAVMIDKCCRSVEERTGN